MATNLYVGNLPYKISNEDLAQHFSQAGSVVRATIISDRATGRSKGFGFVEMASDEEAKKAIEMFDGQNFMDRPLRVNEARPREERPQR